MDNAHLPEGGKSQMASVNYHFGVVIEKKKIAFIDLTP